jgi:transposase-like protein
MTYYNIKLNGNALSNLLSDSNGLAQLLEPILNQVLQSQASEQLGAEPYERNKERAAYRNGNRPRTLYTRIGPLTLQVPQFRDGQFNTDIFKRYQRSEQALVLSLMEMYVNGVSTRKVTKITEQLCGARFSRSTVSDLCLNLDTRVTAFNERKLVGNYPFIIVDCMYFKARENEAIESKACMIACGINEAGEREILGVRIGDSESSSFWKDTFDWLKDRGLKGVKLVVSDHHKGLMNAIERCFIGSSWQRCQVHLMRNVLSYTPSKHKAAMSQGLKRIFKSDNACEARSRFNELADQLEGKAEKALECLENGLEDALTVMMLPDKYRTRLRTSNMIERVNEEVRRRERVVRIFPNKESALRLIGAVLSEIHEQWQERKYFDMTEFHEWDLDRKTQNTDKIISIN